MTMLTKIGNSQGIRIPKPLIAQANLEDKYLDFEIVNDGLLIKPINSTRRKDWKQSIQQTMLNNPSIKDEAVLDDLLDDSDLEDYQW